MAPGSASIRYKEDLAAVGIMIDDVNMENVPMMVVPGSHKGPIHDHHGPDGRSAARWTRKIATSTCRAPCRASARPARSRSTTSARTRLGNRFLGRSRRFLLYQYRAADAWPLLGLKEGIEKFNEQLMSASRASRRAHAVAGADAATSGRVLGLDLREPARPGRRYVATSNEAPGIAAE